MVMEVSFVRHRERRDRVYVRRADGTSTGWDFPTYGDRLPHDACHLVVEDSLGLANGFWGLVEQGVEVKLIDNQATLVRDGRPLIEQPGFDFTDLVRAEEAVAQISAFALPPDASEEAYAWLRQRLRELSDRWRHLEDGQAIILTYDSANAAAGGSAATA
jgi:hypothetical protein